MRERRCWRRILPIYDAPFASLSRIALVLLLTACGGGGGGSSGPPPVATVTVSPAAASIEVGLAVTLTATTADASGNVLTGRVVTWASSNTSVATVSMAGLVTGVAAGQATITATSEGRSGASTVTGNAGLAFATISAGNKHSCGVTVDGIAYCWGDNSAGQLGNGTTISSTTPVAVAGGVSFIYISAGGLHSCGTTAHDKIYCWGDNTFGQLGNGTTTSSLTPVPVSGPLNLSAASAGSRHSCASANPFAGDRLFAYCWGDNSSGQLGNGSMIGSSIPVQVYATQAMDLMSAGSSTSCGLQYTAPDISTFIYSPYCWGDNTFGQLGNGTTTSSSLPVATSNGTLKSLSAGARSTCGTTTSGSVLCWGDNSSGQLGNGTTTSSLIPVAISSGLSFIYVSSGTAHACASSGDLTQPSSTYSTVCWGDNSFGQLGDGTTINRTVPVAVAGGINVYYTSAGNHHSCGVSTSAGHHAYCWGDNSSGQLGNGSTANSSVPVVVTGAL